MVSRDVARDLEHAALFLQGELLAKQGEERAQVGMRERLRSFARQLEDAESLPEVAMRAVVREVRDEFSGLSLCVRLAKCEGPGSSLAHSHGTFVDICSCFLSWGQAQH